MLVNFVYIVVKLQTLLTSFDVFFEPIVGVLPELTSGTSITEARDVEWLMHLTDCI